MLLTVNTLLLVAINVLLNLVVTTTHVVRLPVGIPAVLFGLFWLLTTITCLVGERRLVWGDLGFIGEQHFPWEDFKTEGKTSETRSKFEIAEEEHVKALIVAVAKRTNKFRLAMGLTYFNVALLSLTFITAFWQVKHPHG
jgi:hypothetical protein